MKRELPQRYGQCLQSIGDQICGAHSLEHMRFTETMAEEMSAVDYGARPWQTICVLGHTVTHNVQAPIKDPVPNPNHHLRKQVPPTPQPGQPKPMLCYACAVEFISEPEFAGARPSYCPDCRPKHSRYYRDKMAKMAKA